MRTRHLSIAALVFGLSACVDLSTDYDTSTPAMANLVVVGFWYDNVGDSYVFSALIENQGAAIADSFSVDLYLDRSTEPRLVDQGDATERVLQGLAVGEVVEVSFTVSSSEVSPGSLTWVFADSGGQVDELYEDDNTAGPTEILSR
jgi:subtilase family serine protease